MNNKVLTLIILISVIINIFLLKQNFDLRNGDMSASNTNNDNCLFPDSTYLLDVEGTKIDFRGGYSYPGLGQFILPPPPDDSSKSPFSMVVFLAAKTVGKKDNCPKCLWEFAVYKRLDSLFQTRNQSLLFFAETDDSAAVADYLKKENMTNELIVSSPDSGLSLYQLGISYRNMPFKIVYDSNYNAIYMRGANSTLAGQAEFEKAVRFLSDISIGKYN